jgi:hypothetical protein
LKSYRWILLAAAVLASVAGAQQSPSEVTDAEIAKYKKAAYAGCREPGLARDHPEAKVDAFCTCFMAALDKTMKRTEWQQAYFYWLTEQETEAKAVLAPHVQNLGYCVPK